MQTQARQRWLWAAGVLMASFVASRVTGLARDIAIGYQFGTSREYEAYLAAMRIPDFLFQVMAGGAVASAFIPVLTGYLVAQQREEAWRLASGVFNAALLFLVPPIVVAIIFAPQAIAVIAPGFEPSTRALAADLARILLPSPLLFTWGCFATSVLNAHQRFLLAALAPSLYNLGILGGALVLARPWGVYGLAWGALIGAALFLVIQAPGLAALRMRYQVSLDLRHKGLREVGRLMIPRMVGLGVAQLNLLVALFLASGMAERYAALNYAWLLTMLPLGVIAIAVANAAFPTLSELAARGETAALRATTSQVLTLILFLTIPASIGLLLLAEPTVRILFERGRFTAASTEATAFALRLYALGLPFMAMVEILARALYAVKDTRSPLMASGVALVANIVFSLSLLPFLSYGGLALANSLASGAEAAILVVFARRKLAGLERSGIQTSLVRSVVASLAMGMFLGGIVILTNDLLSRATQLQQALLLAIIVSLSALAYFLIAWLLGSPELRRAREIVAGSLPR